MPAQPTAHRQPQPPRAFPTSQSGPHQFRQTESGQADPTRLAHPIRPTSTNRTEPGRPGPNRLPLPRASHFRQTEPCPRLTRLSSSARPCPGSHLTCLSQPHPTSRSPPDPRQAPPDKPVHTASHPTRRTTPAPPNPSRIDCPTQDPSDPYSTCRAGSRPVPSRQADPCQPKSRSTRIDMPISAAFVPMQPSTGRPRPSPVPTSQSGPHRLPTPLLRRPSPTTQPLPHPVHHRRSNAYPPSPSTTVRTQPPHTTSRLDSTPYPTAQAQPPPHPSTSPALAARTWPTPTHLAVPAPFLTRLLLTARLVP